MAQKTGILYVHVILKVGRTFFLHLERKNTEAMLFQAITSDPLRIIIIAVVVIIIIII